TIRPGFGNPLTARSPGANFHSCWLPAATQRLSDASKRIAPGKKTGEVNRLFGDGAPLFSIWLGRNFMMACLAKLTTQRSPATSKARLTEAVSPKPFPG